MTGWFLFYSAPRHRDSRCSTPPICSFTQSRCGSVFRALQNISLWLTSSLRMVFGIKNFVDIHACCAGKQQLNEAFRKRTDRSFLHPLPAKLHSWFGWPALSPQIVDLRNDRATRLLYAESCFFEFPLGQLHPGFPLKLRQLITHPSQLQGFCTNAFSCAGRGLIGSAPARQSSCTAEIVNDNIQTNRGPRLQRCACSWKVCTSMKY